MAAATESDSWVLAIMLLVGVAALALGRFGVDPLRWRLYVKIFPELREYPASPPAKAAFRHALKNWSTRSLRTVLVVVFIVYMVVLPQMSAKCPLGGRCAGVPGHPIVAILILAFGSSVVIPLLTRSTIRRRLRQDLSRGIQHA